MYGSLGKPIGSGIALIGLSGAALGAGITLGSYIYSVGRNPLLKEKLFRETLICFALIESFALFSLLLSFLILFA